MKKFIASLLALIAVFACTGCGHMHTVDRWHVDYYYHFHVCTECGEETDKTPHEFGKDEICIICNSKVVLNDNGNITVTVYNEEGDITRELVFDKEGKLIKETAVNR